MTFIEDGEEVEVQAEVGKTLLEVAHANEIDLEGARTPIRRLAKINHLFYACVASTYISCHRLRGRRRMRRFSGVLDVPPDTRAGHVRRAAKAR